MSEVSTFIRSNLEVYKFRYEEKRYRAAAHTAMFIAALTTFKRSTQAESFIEIYSNVDDWLRRDTAVNWKAHVRCVLSVN